MPITFASSWGDVPVTGRWKLSGITGGILQLNATSICMAAALLHNPDYALEPPLVYGEG